MIAFNQNRTHRICVWSILLYMFILPSSRCDHTPTVIFFFVTNTNSSIWVISMFLWLKCVIISSHLLFDFSSTGVGSWLNIDQIWYSVIKISLEISDVDILLNLPHWHTKSTLIFSHLHWIEVKNDESVFILSFFWCSFEEKIGKSKCILFEGSLFPGNQWSVFSFVFADFAVHK